MIGPIVTKGMLFMTAPSLSERDFYASLTRILMDMKDAPQTTVQAAVEDHFRRYLIMDNGSCPGSLQITWTCSLPEGPNSFAIYRTEYQVEFETENDKQNSSPANSGTSAEIILFPLAKA